MTLAAKIRRAAKEWIFGDTMLPEEFTVGIADPQTEVTVWLLGAGNPLDVTYRHSTVCADPFTLCVAFDEQQPYVEESLHPTLRFCERGGESFILGEIGLRYKDRLSLDGMTFCFFEPLRVRNDCFPEMSMYVHLVRHLYRQHKAKKNTAMGMSFLHRRASMVSFIRPHPTVLVSVRGAAGENLIPMNLMGQLGERHFGFALRHDRYPAKIIEQTLQLAISNVPLAQAPLAYSYAGHHTVESIRLSDLPFGVRRSARLKLSVPEFAQRVREFEVVRVHKGGTHTFFIARLLHDEVLSDAPTLSVIHGYYQAWRLKQRQMSARESVADDRFHKYGERLT